jgi:hypothetical protein
MGNKLPVISALEAKEKYCLQYGFEFAPYYRLTNNTFTVDS